MIFFLKFSYVLPSIDSFYQFVFCDIHFRLVANCDWFFFIYVVCHIPIFLRSQIVTLNVL